MKGLDYLILSVLYQVNGMLLGIRELHKLRN